MHRRWFVLSVVLLVLALVGACGGTAVPDEEPSGPVALEVKGLVDNPLSLSLDSIKALGVETITAEHPKNGPQEYEGVRLQKVLDKAGLQDGASILVITASDDYSAEAALSDVQGCADCMIEVADDGTLSMVLPGMSSKAWVKDVVSIEIK
ncbi:MAG: hypothetical protein JXA37_11950 [Chloroflexia bacterium]|nr:hypothetical protein [Chloroflexia bacterium]